MTIISFLRERLQPMFVRVPALRSVALTLVDIAARPLLWPFRRDRPPADQAAAKLAANADRLNASAESYYAIPANAEHAVNKPYSEPEAFSSRLMDIGVLLDGMRLRPGQTVLDFGAGPCWLSHMLNRLGCRTISVDVSVTAIELGRRLFAADPHTNWGLNPQFFVYDGHRLPLESASVDRVVLYDAFHHIPNQAEVLREIRRVLRSDGIVAMSEPGRGHARSASSIQEAATTGVLENELVLEDIADLALEVGFRAARVAVDTNTPLLEIDAKDLRRFMGGHGFARYWRNLCGALDGHHYILLFAGGAEPTTQQPRRLKAVIRPRHTAAGSVAPGKGDRLRMNIYNAGDTVWLCGEGDGWTRIGMHLYRADTHRTVVDYDWARAALPHDVLPERSVNLELSVPPIDTPGHYVIVVDLVIEGVAWFADRGSAPLQVDWRVM